MSGIGDIFGSVVGGIGDLLWKDGGPNWDVIGPVAGGLASVMAGGANQQPQGYQGGIPELVASREQTHPYMTTGEDGQPTFNTDRRPGSGGMRYFSDFTYTPTGKVLGHDSPQGGAGGSGPSAGTGMQDFLSLLLALKAQPKSNQGSWVSGKDSSGNPIQDRVRNWASEWGYNPGEVIDVVTGRARDGSITDADHLESLRVKNELMSPKVLADVEAWAKEQGYDPEVVKQNYLNKVQSGEIDAHEDIAVYADRNKKYAHGGSVDGRYLRGSQDGMGDGIAALIDGSQPAALSHGEFVIPADVVSHLGNGNSDAGARELEEMMTRIRKQRTGNKKQAPQVNPKSALPV